MRPWETTRRGGGVGQAGIPAAPPAHPTIASNPCGLLLEAIVLRTYYAEEDDRPFAGTGQKSILLDVRVTSGKPYELFRVPLLGVHQLHDEDLRVPRAVSQDIEGQALATHSAGTTKPTRAQNMDGDMVLIGFVNGSISEPRAFPFGPVHVSGTALAQSVGRVRRIRHNGTLIQWDKDGNLDIDARGAAKDALGANGAEVSNSGTGGKITIQTKDGTSAVSKIELDASGGVKLTDGAGDIFELVKSGAKAHVKSTVFQAEASASAALDAPIVTLSTAPREPVIKATTFNTQHSIMLGLVAAAFTALAGACTAGGAALTQISTESTLSPGTQSVCGWAGGIVSGAAAACTAAAVGITTTFLPLAPNWTSTKVTTG